MEDFLQYVFDGLSVGSVYALMALGLVIIYRGTGHLNFAQGEMALFSTYVVYQMGEWGIPIGFALIIGLAVGFCIGALAEVTLIRPVAKKSPFAVFIVTLGLFQFLNWLDGAIWGDQVLPNSGVGSRQKAFPTLFPSGTDDFVSILGAAWRLKYLGVLVLVLVLTALLFVVFNRTRLGLAMRAVASNPESAKLVGIRTNSILMFSWGLASAIGALGGVVFAGINNTVNLGLMFTVFIYGSAAATLGGFDSPGGAVIAGLSIGVIENLAAGYAQEWVGQELKLGVAFVIIVVVLMVKPSGLFGTSKVGTRMNPWITMRQDGPAHWAVRIVTAVVVVGVLVWIPTQGGNGLITDAMEAFTLMAAAMALNLLLGFTEQISIGHSAFFGIGAYTTAVCVSRSGFSPWITFLLGFVVAFVVGVVISFPASRIKGVYLALVTLSLALVFPALLSWRKLAWLTGGGPGLPNDDSKIQTTGFDIGRREGQMRHFAIFGWDPFGDLRSIDAKTPFYYWIGVVVVVVVYLVCRGVVKSRAGRALIAVRDNETAAAVMGVNLVATKAFVFGISAGLCALPGSFSAIRVGNVSPSLALLTLLGSITFLIVMVIGGAGSLWGPIIGAVLYIIINSITGSWADDDEIPAVLRPFFAWAKTPPGTGIFAVMLILLMFVAPLGLVGAWKQYSRRIVRVVPRPIGVAADVEQLAPEAEPSHT